MWLRKKVSLTLQGRENQSGVSCVQVGNKSAVISMPIQPRVIPRHPRFVPVRRLTNHLNSKVSLVLLSVKSIEQHDALGHLHICQVTGVGKAQKQRPQALDVWGQGREESRREEEWVGCSISCCWWPPFNLIISDLLSFASCIWTSLFPWFTRHSYQNSLTAHSTWGETGGQIGRKKSREKQSAEEKTYYSR